MIPIYNYSVVALVKALEAQIQSSDIIAEIICLDDASQNQFKVDNRSINAFANTKLIELDENVGRAAIRNLLAEKAKYDLLLFLDCDSGLIQNDFIKTYLECHQSSVVTVGGRVYSQNAPQDLTKLLHWKYGRIKESRSLIERRNHPVRYFHSNNFLIEKAVISKLGFDESIKSYGYEDLLLAQKLKQGSIDIRHIDNPVEHLDLQSNEVFLTKVKMAINNLKAINSSGENLNSNLEIMAAKVNKYGLSKPVQWLAKKIEASSLKNLKSTQPNLRLLDIYKLGCYLKGSKN